MFSKLHKLTMLQMRASLVMLALLAVPGVAIAQSVLTDDSQTTQTNKTLDTNFGAKPVLTVSSTSSAYIKFKLSSTLPSGTRGIDVARATMKLYISGLTSPGKIDVYQAAGAWTENVLTFNNAPSAGPLIASTTQIDEDKKGAFIVVDVTTAVQQWLGDDGQGTNGAPNHGLVLVAHPIDATTPALVNVTFDSKENVQTSHEPSLNLALKSPSGIQSIAHDATLSGDGTAASPLSVPSQSIGATQLTDGAVTNIKLADAGVTNEKLADGAVTNPKIANGSVSGDKIANNAISNIKLVDWAVTTTKLADGAVSSEKIANGAITNIKLSDLIVTTSKIANGSVTEQKIGTGQVLKGLNGLKDNVTLIAGPSISITTIGNSLGISSSALPSVSHNATLVGSGTANSPLGVVVPLNLVGQEGNTNPTLSVVNQGSGPAIYAIGSVDTSSHYSLNGVKMLSNPGFGNTFLGRGSGENIDMNNGMHNSFFGEFSGQNNTEGQHNAFVGANAGRANTTGGSNSFFGSDSGLSSTSGFSNSFFGRDTGRANTTGGGNSFFGVGAGRLNISGTTNSFFGISAGTANTEGSNNAFFGANAGAANTTGMGNSSLGVNAGWSNTTGTYNVFVGGSSGMSNTSESNNTFVGVLSNGVPGITNATAIGYEAQVTQSNSVVLGQGASVGIGTSAPKTKLHVVGGRVYVESQGQGIILRSPNGAVCIEITASNIGSLQYGPIPCP